MNRLRNKEVSRIFREASVLLWNGEGVPCGRPKNITSALHLTGKDLYGGLRKALGILADGVALQVHSKVWLANLSKDWKQE